MASANCLTTVLDNGRLAVFASKYSAAFFGVIDWTLLRTKSAPLLDIAIDQTLATRANRTLDSDPSKVDLDESAFRLPAVEGHRRGCLFAVGDVHDQRERSTRWVPATSWVKGSARWGRSLRRREPT